MFQLNFTLLFFGIDGSGLRLRYSVMLHFSGRDLIHKQPIDIVDWLVFQFWNQKVDEDDSQNTECAVCTNELPRQ